MLKKTKYSLCIPIFANPGMLSFRTPNYKKLKFDDLKKLVLMCDKSNFNSIFIMIILIWEIKMKYLNVFH